MKKTTPSSRKKHPPPKQSYGGKGERRKQLITMIKITTVRNKDTKAFVELLPATTPTQMHQ